MVDPARLAWGLQRVAQELGVRIHERTPVTGLASTRPACGWPSPAGTIDARRVVLGTNGFTPLVRSIRRIRRARLRLRARHRAALGGSARRDRLAERQGFADSTNHFHYFRTTEDGRILWGGYDAIYHFASGVRPEFEQRDATFSLLARQFFDMFPQLEGLRFRIDGAA